jgi:hypothetical protein
LKSDQAFHLEFDCGICARAAEVSRASELERRAFVSILE